MKHLTLAALMAAAALPAMAEGDAGAGETQFGRQCVACHVIDTGSEVLAGRNARTGPNLFDVAGATPGTVPGFDYGESIVAWGATGAVWDEESFVAYVTNPTAFLREATGDERARGKMAFQVRDEQQAHDIWAYLVSLEPAAE